MGITLFGYTIARDTAEKEAAKSQTYIMPQAEDGASTVQAGGYFGTYVDLDATSKSESELITRYREASMYSTCSTAIDEIVDDAIASVDNEKPVKIILDNSDLPMQIRKTIETEFEYILNKLDFKLKGQDIFRRWYVDGRLYYQKVIDPSNPRKGIIELRQIDPRKIKKVREVKKEKNAQGIDVIKSIEEFFIYNEKGIQQNPNYATTNMPTQGIRISGDSITYITSGLTDLEKNVVLSYLHKALKPVNQLKMMEDALVIYRLSRAPERRVFYVDVGNLPKIKAEQYLKDIMARYRNKIVYDSTTGEIRDDRKFMSMLEDFWLPRREGGRGTEITTLPGGENLGQIADIEYFQTKLYQSLNVPMSRLQPQSGLNFGRAAEITRDELKFAKFVNRLRLYFNSLFQDILKTHLILKGVLTESDWDDIKHKIDYVYARDQYYEEMKETENLRNRVDILTQMAPFVGQFFSKEYVMKKVLRLNEQEISEMNDEMAEAPMAMQQPQIQPNPMQINNTDQTLQE